MSILSSLKRHRKKSIAAAILIVLLGFGIGYASRPAEPEYVTAPVKKMDLRQTVEAVGTVVSERELELRFAGVGIVANVLVKEGDRVRAGQVLAQLRAGSLGASVAAQAAGLQSALAELRALEEGTRPEDIAIAEADVDSKRSALRVAESTKKGAEDNLVTAKQKLATLEQEAAVSLLGEISTSVSDLSQDLVSAENALSTMQDVLDQLEGTIEKSKPELESQLDLLYANASSALGRSRLEASSAHTYTEALQALRNSTASIQGAVSAMDTLFSVVSTLPETTYFSAADRESYKSTITAQRSTLQTAAASVSGTQSALQNASAGYDTKISAEKSNVTSLEGTAQRAQTDILTYQSAIRSAEAQLALKRAGARKSDVDAARARVRQAQANLARAQADYGDTVLTAPIAGTVSHVFVKGGESLPSGAAVTLLGDSPFRVEMFVSEIDIPKVQITQSGSVELDAFRGTNFQLRVGEVDSSSTDKEGVPKYRVKLDFVYRHDELKIGMTGDAEIITGTREDVLTVPRRAVIEDADGKSIVRILKEDATIEERPVTLGIEGSGGDVEIVSGVKEGETVVVLTKK